MSEERRCHNKKCRKVLAKKTWESWATFYNRLHCDQKCRLANGKRRAKRICKRCGGGAVSHELCYDCRVATGVCSDGKCLDCGSSISTSAQRCVTCANLAMFDSIPDEPNAAQIAEMEQRKAEILAQKLAKESREIPAAVEITVVPIRSLGVTPIWNWDD